MEPKDTPRARPDCPTRDVLTDFFLGLLAPSRRAAVEEHLASCPACQSTLSSIRDAAGSDKGSHTSTDSQRIHSTSAGEPRDTPANGALPHDLPPGTLALPRSLGQYRLLERLGQGGMGTVYKAQHTRLKRLVAIKTLRPDRFQGPQAVARFYREMEAVGRLDHPNLVRASDANEVGGCHFLVMEFLDGTDLAHLADRHGRLRVADACEVVRQAALGLQYAHEQGLVHRDVKPSNLLLTPAGIVKVLDLGLARLRSQPEAGDERFTGSEVLGTADYMAPEQGMRSHDVDIRADVYSLGCTLYKLLAGNPPFSGPEYGSFFSKMQAHAQKPIPPIRSVRTDVPDGLAKVLQRMLAKAPADRFATPGEVALALRLFTAGCDLAALASLPAEAEVRLSRDEQATVLARPRADWSRRIPLWQGLTAALLLAGAAVAGVLLLLAGGTPISTSPGTQPAHLVPGVWHEVQDREPVVLRQPERGFRWEIDKERQLCVNSPKSYLIRLGQTADCDYEIEAIISQHTWVGKVGLFIGYRELPHDRAKPDVRYQRIEVAPVGGQQPGQFKVARSVVTYEAAGTSNGQPAGEEDLTPPIRLGDQRLSLKVGKNGLESVSWDGQELPNIPAANEKVRKDDYQGAFGIYGYESDSTFRRVRYRFQPRGTP